MEEDVGSAQGFRVVCSSRACRGIRVGDPVVLLPVEAVRARVELLRLPTVRRVAGAGLRGVVLVPLAEWSATFPEMLAVAGR